MSGDVPSIVLGIIGSQFWSPPKVPFPVPILSRIHLTCDLNSNLTVYRMARFLLR
jgi:hypothetical protein